MGVDFDRTVQIGVLAGWDSDNPTATMGGLVAFTRGQAFLEGRGYVTPQDIKTIGPDILRHRVTVTYEAEAEEIASEQLLQRIFDKIKVQ